MVRPMLTFLTFCALAAPVAAMAQQPVALDTQLFRETVRTDINGRMQRQLAAPHTVSPGDRLVFIVRYHNEGAAPVSHFTVTNPLPGTVRFEGAADRNVEVSVDGGQNWGRLGALMVHTETGGVRPATAQDVTHLRWILRAPISPGESGQFSYRGSVR